MGWAISHYVKLALDEAFGAERFINQVIWRRQSAHADVGQGSKHLGPIHDVILLYSKGEKYRWNMQYTPYTEEYINRNYRHVEPETDRRYRLDNLTGPGGAAAGNPRYEVMGVTRYWRYSKKRMEELVRQGRVVQTRPGTVPAYKRYLDEMPGVPLQDMWLDIGALQSNSAERLGYDTQKPEALLKRVIELGSNPGDLVADFFCGSGTTAAVAEKTGRRWLACDLSRYAVHTTRKRLLDIDGCRPFDVLNLGRYERQFWQGAAFGGGREVTERTLYEYIAFVLRRYGAEPISGSAYLHGRKGAATVHVGSVDAPVTIGEVASALEECAELGQKELHVLGWEWEMGLAGPNAGGSGQGGPMQEEARRLGVKLLLLQIPREVMEQQAVDRGDVRFFELAYLEVGLENPDGPRSLKVTLGDFVVPNTELIPEEVREKVEKSRRRLGDDRRRPGE